MELLWITLESEHTQKMMKQHAFVPKISKGGNKRNISLCGKYRAIGEDGKAEMFDKLDEDVRGERFDYFNACKNCVKRTKNL